MTSRRWFVNERLLQWKQMQARGDYEGPFFTFPYGLESHARPIPPQDGSPLETFKTGARVRKSARHQDPRTGTVHRGTVEGRSCVGVLWDGGNGRIIEFSGDYPLFEECDAEAQTRYRIVGDNSGHDYYIPVYRSDDWERFAALDEDDERSWEAPDFAVRIDGTFTFADPRCE